MKQIPQQLQDKDFAFIKLDGKKPIECGWTNEAQYTWDDPELQKHEGNIGVSCGATFSGSNFVVIDIDHEDGLQLIKGLPPTLTDKTKKGYHYWLETDGEVGQIKLEVDGKHVGEIQGLNHCVVAPYSKDVDGNESYIPNLLPIAYVPLHELRSKLRVEPRVECNISSKCVGDKSISSKVNIFEDEEFEPLSYYVKKGVSLIEFLDLINVDRKEVWDVFRNKITVYATRGHVHKSPSTLNHPEGFMGEHLEIRLTRQAIKSIKAHGKKLSHCYMIFYRPTERLMCCEIVASDQYEKLLSQSEDEIIKSFPRFMELERSKLINMGKHGQVEPMIKKLLDGVIDPKLTDVMMIPLTEKAVKLGYRSHEIHRMYKIYFKDHYNVKETNAQIGYARRKMGK